MPTFQNGQHFKPIENLFMLTSAALIKSFWQSIALKIIFEHFGKRFSNWKDLDFQLIIFPFTHSNSVKLLTGY